VGFDTPLPMSWQPAHDRDFTYMVPYEFSQRFVSLPIERCSIADEDAGDRFSAMPGRSEAGEQRNGGFDIAQPLIC
jgi:hypothetical protein